ncbi:hypothetical protein KI387_008420, partial [Taxus chinensis]
VSEMIMIKMMGNLREVMVDVEDTMVDLEVEAMAVDEMSSLVEHAIRADPLTIT